MKIVKTAIHPSVTDMTNLNILKRIATRAIVLRNSEVLLLYTNRYDDYSLPGGGVDDNEEIEDGLIRELREETGASGIKKIKPFCIYEEFRPLV